jgi:hypothetical protein
MICSSQPNNPLNRGARRPRHPYIRVNRLAYQKRDELSDCRFVDGLVGRGGEERVKGFGVRLAFEALADKRLAVTISSRGTPPLG